MLGYHHSLLLYLFIILFISIFFSFLMLVQNLYYIGANFSKQLLLVVVPKIRRYLQFILFVCLFLLLIKNENKALLSYYFNINNN